MEAAKAAGGKVLAGGAKPDGSSREYPPTVVRVERDDSPLMSDETFGPVLPIAVVDDADEAVKRANASRYGLTASVWTKNRKRGALSSKKLRAGVVTINNHAFTGALAERAVERSRGDGLGHHRLTAGARRRSRGRASSSSTAAAAPSELWWYPYTPALRNVALAMVRRAE